MANLTRRQSLRQAQPVDAVDTGRVLPLRHVLAQAMEPDGRASNWCIGARAGGRNAF